ncbi:MAG TPA: glycosyltransferase family 1 protein [Candidatus Dormibacteraeota bacterium]|nr:glycosyltransferase family 1 protein [Candidatus Dormibacteraeota bacterium]
MSTFRGSERLSVTRYAVPGPPVLGPQVFEPLRMLRDQATLIHGPANALPLLRFGLPGVVTIHDLAIYDHPEWFPRGQWFATRLVVPRSIRRADAVITPSVATKDAVIRLFGVDPARCRVIPHGVEADFALPASATVRAAVRAKYGLPERYLIQVGTIQPRKNYLTTLQALARMPLTERLPLVAVGDAGWGDDPVVETSRRLRLQDWVHFVGYAPIADLPALYQLAEAAIFPSLDEGFGLPVLEAFAAGVPLAASNAGAIPEVAGDAALLSDPHDDQALADNLTRIISDATLRARLVASGRARAQRYSWSASGAEHRTVYETVAGW